jgi:hypothetical protein
MATRLTLSSIWAAVIIAGSPVLFGQTRIWSAAGITGIVDDADLSIHSFNSTGSVSIKSSVAAGTLDIRFPVQTLPDLLPPQPGDCVDMRVNLRDTGPGARVIVRLRALSIFPGSGTRLSTLATIDSDTLPPINDPTQYRPASRCVNNPPPGVESIIDYAFYAYYVDAQLIKTTASANPGLMSVQICPAEDACDP